MNYKRFILCLLVLGSLSFTMHKYYLSLTQIEFNAKTKSLEVITNVFVDDLEKVLNDSSGKDLRLNTPREHKASDSLIKDYLKTHLQFEVNQQKVTPIYIGKEYEGDIVFFYIEITGINQVKSIGINNSLLTATFEDQQNLVKSKIGSKHQSALLTKSNNKALLKY